MAVAGSDSTLHVKQQPEMAAENTNRQQSISTSESEEESEESEEESAEEGDAEEEQEVEESEDEVEEEQDVEEEKSSSSTDELLDYKLENFELVKTVGTGTFGRVILCRYRGRNKYYAMKALAISDVIKLKQVEHVRNEKSILAQIDHPFVIKMYWTHHDRKFLYMLFEYVNGGELFTYLRNAGRFSNSASNFYAAEIVSVLDYLHQRAIVYRDLKPENLLLDHQGHLKITDFGFAKVLHDRTWTLCGTPEYLAPEIIQSKGHNKAVDWWALGILIYEMLAGYPPFFDENPFGIYEKILAGHIDWPKHIDPVAKDLIKKFLVQDRTRRLGNMKNGADDVKNHRWFRHVSWDDVIDKKLNPPIVPKVSFAGDTNNFDDYPENEWNNKPSASERDLKCFQDF
ncbi:cAMP-dependent protein kinase [Chamberlinius hualienensis]